MLTDLRSHRAQAVERKVLISEMIQADEARKYIKRDHTLASMAILVPHPFARASAPSSAFIAL